MLDQEKLPMVKGSSLLKIPIKLQRYEEDEKKYLQMSFNSSFAEFNMMKYVENPRVKTKSELIELRKLEIIRKEMTNSMNVHLNQSKRVKQRETQLICSTSQVNPYQAHKKQQKLQDLVNFNDKFSCTLYGIHQSELPKFRDIREKLFNFPKNSEKSLPKPIIQKKQKSISEKAASASFTILSNNIDLVDFIEIRRKTAYIKEKREKTNENTHSLIKKPRETLQKSENPAKNQYSLIPLENNHIFSKQTSQKSKKIRTNGFNLS